MPDCRGANRMWLERKRFPALELGIIAITTGVKADDLGDQKKEEVPLRNDRLAPRDCGRY